MRGQALCEPSPETLLGHALAKCTCEGTTMTGHSNEWSPERPNTLVIACSDGRLQESTDEFLAHHLHVTRYDRFYVPGGGGALSASGRDFLRAQQLRRECRYLID